MELIRSEPLSDYSLVDFCDEFKLFEAGETERQRKIADLLLGFFKNDEEKVRAWYKTENPMLGGTAPIDMIRQGRSEKLLKFIKTSILENIRTSEDAPAEFVDLMNDNIKDLLA
jgi:hypothetical protein